MLLLLEMQVLINRNNTSNGIGRLSVKGQIANTLGFADHMVSVATIPLCHHSMKIGIDGA